MDDYLFEMNDRPMPRLMFLHIINDHLYDNKRLFMTQFFLSRFNERACA